MTHASTVTVCALPGHVRIVSYYIYYITDTAICFWPSVACLPLTRTGESMARRLCKLRTVYHTYVMYVCDLQGGVSAPSFPSIPGHHPVDGDLFPRCACPPDTQFGRKNYNWQFSVNSSASFNSVDTTCISTSHGRSTVDLHMVHMRSTYMEPQWIVNMDYR